jgi:hypothetical protein
MALQALEAPNQWYDCWAIDPGSCSVQHDNPNDLGRYNNKIFKNAFFA